MRVTCSVTGFLDITFLLVDAGVNNTDNDRAIGLTGVSLAMCGVALRDRLCVCRL